MTKIDPEIFEKAADLVDSGWWCGKSLGKEYYVGKYYVGGVHATKGAPQYWCALQALNLALKDSGYDSFTVEYKDVQFMYLDKIADHLGLMCSAHPKQAVIDWNDHPKQAVIDWNDHIAKPGEVSSVFREIAEKIRADNGSIDN